MHPAIEDDDADWLDPHCTVTNGERFAALHTVATALFAELAQTYAVTSVATLDAVGNDMPTRNLRPPITLYPDGGGAPLAVVFTTEASVLLRVGWWYREGFPFCSCDGCALTVAAVAQRLRERCAAVVAGEFQEEIETRPVWHGMAFSRFSFGAGRSQSALPAAEALRLRAGLPERSTWAPWVRRAPG